MDVTVNKAHKMGLNPWANMYPKELRVNFDVPLVNAFASYGDMKKRFPDISLGRRQFRTTKEFCETSNLSTDIYRQEKPGPEVIKT